MQGGEILTIHILVFKRYVYIKEKKKLTLVEALMSEREATSLVFSPSDRRLPANMQA